MTVVLPPAPVFGDLAPSILARAPWARSAGGEAVDLGKSVRLFPDEAQVLLLDVMLAERANGKWAALEVGYTMARQNGKGLPFDLAELHALYVLEDRLVLHSAHLFSTALKAFKRMEELVTNWDDLRRRVKRINRSHGEEGIELMHPTQEIQYTARSGRQGRGFTAERLFLDEAQDLPMEAIAALVPTLSARSIEGNPQLCLTGTVPKPGERGAPFTSLRDRGRAAFDNNKGVARNLTWGEWSAGRQLPVDVDERVALTQDRALWAASNPALGRRISEEFLESEIDMFINDPEQGLDAVFREIILIWEDGKGGGIFKESQWGALLDTTAGITGKPVFGIDCPPDQRHASISIAGHRPDGLIQVELAARAPGLGWICDWFKALPPMGAVSRVATYKPKCLVIHKGSPVMQIHDDLTALGVLVEVVDTGGYARACGSMLGMIRDVGPLRHRGQKDLDKAVYATGTRGVGDALVFEKRGGSDICPFTAATLAVTGLINTQDPTSVYEERGVRVLD